MAKLYFRYGAMSCGKTTAILQVAHNYEEKGNHIIIIKPSKDTKGAKCIVNRTNLQREVDFLVSPTDKIIDYLYTLENPNLDAILVDEAQIFTAAQIEELYTISKILDIPVLCYGLRCDFQMKGWEGATRLLQLADDIEELKTICRCKKKATISVRMINGIPVFDGPQVAIDGEDNTTYESFCASCYLKLREEYDPNFKIDEKIKLYRTRKLDNK